MLGKVKTKPPQLGESFHALMAMADKHRGLGVRTNADNPHDAAVGREFGAEGIGLCRTEHMFFEDSRIRAMRRMILAESRGAREAALALQARGHQVGVFTRTDRPDGDFYGVTTEWQ